MTAQHLADELARMIRAGEISPNTPVVRRFCMCDDEYGWVGVKSVDIMGRPEKADGTLSKTAAKGDQKDVVIKLG
jgi:hypothetical protein